MTDTAAAETLRAVFRTIPQGLVLRKAPTVAIDMRVLRWVFGPAQTLVDLKKKTGQAKPSRS
ncbi:MAG: hypothetical protein WBC26_07820 [Alphaproteobacteria bacterium]|nr:hypothetical protein [Alphaproteobacteria bacterium]